MIIKEQGLDLPPGNTEEWVPGLAWPNNYDELRYIPDLEASGRQAWAGQRGKKHSGQDPARSGTQEGHRQPLAKLSNLNLFP